MAKTPKVTKRDRVQDSRGSRPERRALRFVPVVVALVTISAFAAGVWYAYDQGVKEGIRVKPPMIKAEPGPTKVVPENPGGLQVPNQDKQVFDRIASAPPEPKVEQLLPPQETPLPEKLEPILPQPPDAAEAEPAVETTGEANTEPVEQPPKETTKAEPVKPETAEEKPVQEAARASDEPVGTGKVRIQLAAFREEKAARTGWDRLKNKFAEELSNLKPFVARVDLGKDKGVFYRLQAGPLNDRRDAERLCATLKARKQSCLVVVAGGN